MTQFSEADRLSSSQKMSEGKFEVEKLLLQIDSDSDYSIEALQMIQEGTDAKIDDEELLGSKKGLTIKGTPFALLNALYQKW